MTEIRSSHKSGNQMSVFFVQKALQTFYRFCDIFLRSQLEIQCHNMCGLCLCCHISFCIEEGLLEFLYDLMIKLLILCCHILFSKGFRHLDKKSGRVCIICRTGQIIWCGSKVAAFFCIKSYPVAKLQLVVPDIINSMGTHEVNPSLHTVVLFFQNIFITIHQIHGPWIDDGCISPGCCGMRSLAEKPVSICTAFLNVRNNMRYTALWCLINLQIMEPFLIERICIHQISGGTAEDLRISSPSQTLITLRAVCRYIKEITLQPPQEIVMQLVQQRIRTLQTSV